MENNVAVPRLFQGTFKGLDQMMGEFSDKSYGVGKEKFLTAGKCQSPGSGIQGGEKFIFCQDSRISETI